MVPKAPPPPVAELTAIPGRAVLPPARSPRHPPRRALSARGCRSPRGWTGGSGPSAASAPGPAALQPGPGRGREGGPVHVNPLPQPPPGSPPLRGGAGRSAEEGRGAEEGPCGALCLAAGSAPLPRALPLSFRARPALSPLSASLSPLTPAAGGTRPLRAAPRAQPETDREAAAPSAPHFPPAAAAILPPSARLPLTGLVTWGGGGGGAAPPTALREGGHRPAPLSERPGLAARRRREALLDEPAGLPR